jgi:long-chain acyl-CoA synthetase
MKDLIQYISENKNTNPNKVLIKTPAKDYSYKEVATKITNLSLHLNKNDQKQRHIAILLDDSPEFIIAFLAVQRISDVAVLFPVSMDEAIIQQKIDSLNISTVIYQEKYRPIINKTKHTGRKIVVGNNIDDEKNFQELTESTDSYNIQIPFMNIDQPSILIFTSGATGNPKNILLSHKSLVQNALSCQHIIQNEKSLNFLGYPEFANFISLVLVISLAISSSGIITIPESKDSKTLLHTIKNQNAEVFVSVPKNLKDLIENSDNFKINNLKYTLSLSAPIENELIDAWIYNFQCTLWHGYGLAESLVVSFNNKIDNHKLSSMGKALPDCNMKIMNSMQIELPTGRVGELHIQSPSNLHSYYNSDKNKNRRNKWLATGDLVKKDPDGYYHYIDKKINVIHKKGFTIFPGEIEEILLKHPSVNKVHVLKLLGEKDDNIKFCIIPKEETNLEKNDIKEFARENLPQFLQPEFIEIYNRFPENDLGKILRDKFIHSH